MGVIEEMNTVFELPDGSKIEVAKDDIEYIFKGYRPRNMDYEVFRHVRKVISKVVKNHLKGELVHLSKVTDSVWANYTKGKKIKQRGNTYVKEK